MLSKEVSSTIFKVFGMTRLGIEPRSSGPLANLRSVCQTKKSLNIKKSIYQKSSVWLDLRLNPGLPDHWRTLYPLDKWAGYTRNTTQVFSLIRKPQISCLFWGFKKRNREENYRYYSKNFRIIERWCRKSITKASKDMQELYNFLKTIWSIKEDPFERG